MTTNWPKTNEGTFFTAEMSNGSPPPRAEYPTRYYAELFSKEEAEQHGYPGQVKGWIDAWALSSIENFPPANKLVPMTIEQWEFHFVTDDQGISLHLLATYLDGEFHDLR